MSLALYRTYRPRKLSEILGQPSIIQVLRNAAQRNKIAHAYLFYGPRGSGKTTAARILAKLANCETRIANEAIRKTGEPCNRCRPCEEIDEGRALDVVEIDAASNRGIDEIRALRETIVLSPTSYARKVFIIDEAHQLTKEAWNALLKTLEEPPAHALFILATTEYEKVPTTIASRTQRFHFRKLSIVDIVQKLKSIVRLEKFSVSDEALELIARSSEGSVRDAESLLDQLAALEDTVTLTSVEEIIGKVGHKRISECAAFLFKEDLSGSLRSIAKIQEGGSNIIEFTKELIHYLRRALTLSVDPSLSSLLEHELTEHELAELSSQAATLNPARVVPLLQSIIRAWSEMRYAPFAAIPLEIALIEHFSKKKQ